MVPRDDSAPPPAARFREVPVWDLPTRLFHWALALLVALAWVSGDQGHFDVHFLAGYAILALLLFRLAWGVVGSRTARFADFVKGPAEVFGYAAGLLGRRRPAPPVLGHNPMGGLMVVALIALLMVQAVSGLFTTDDILTDGPLVSLVTSAQSARLSTVHRTAVDILLVMIALHVVAVIAYRVLKREDLVRPMVTGRKRVTGDGEVVAPRQESPLRAAAVLAAAAATVFAVLQLA